MVKLRKEIHYGEAVSRCYGIAYFPTNRAVAICYPIPLNIIVGFWYYSVIWLRGGLAWGYGFWVRRNRVLTDIDIVGEEHQLISRLTPYIERAGYRWTLTSVNNPVGQHRSHLTIE